jgi:hypothetical protein
MYCPGVCLRIIGTEFLPTSASMAGVAPIPHDGD